MTEFYDVNLITALEIWVAVTELFPDLAYGAVSAIVQRNAVEAYRAFDNGALADVPSTLAAYLRHQINQTQYH